MVKRRTAHAPLKNSTEKLWLHALHALSLLREVGPLLRTAAGLCLRVENLRTDTLQNAHLLCTVPPALGTVNAALFEVSVGRRLWAHAVPIAIVVDTCLGALAALLLVEVPVFGVEALHALFLLGHEGPQVGTIAPPVAVHQVIRTLLTPVSLRVVLCISGTAVTLPLCAVPLVRRLTGQALALICEVGIGGCTGAAA